MKILSRYLIRALLGPFFFSLTALTGILFLNAVAMEMDKLSGKGLEWEIIAQFMVLTLPHTLALTLPMAVLVAVLHAFSEMAASNEITAMKAGGISPRNIMRPLLGMGLLAAATVFVFNDRILPEANHLLKNLMQDINRKSPTFILREQAVNRVVAGQDGQVFYLIAREIDNDRSMLTKVTVVDANNPTRSATTFADSASMAFSVDRTDLFLTMHDGVQYQTADERPGEFSADRFGTRKIAFRGVGDEFERGGETRREDRELTVGQLLERARERDQSLRNRQTTNRDRTVQAVHAALGHEVTDSVVQRWVSSTELASARFREARQFVGSPVWTFDRLTDALRQETRSSVNGMRADLDQARRLRVEVHKKMSMAVACIIFVLLGAPLAIRFPRGGLGLVIAASAVVFSVYWVGLIVGEKLADQGMLPPWLAMWLTNLIFLAIGIRLYRHMGKEAGSTRGGGIEELWPAIRGLFRRAPRLPSSSPAR